MCLVRGLVRPRESAIAAAAVEPDNGCDDVWFGLVLLRLARGLSPDAGRIRSRGTPPLTCTKEHFIINCSIKLCYRIISIYARVEFKLLYVYT